MTIEKGNLWGRPGRLPDDGVLVRTDFEAREAVTAAQRTGQPLPTLGLLGGDLARTCGAGDDEARLRSEHAQTLPVDLGEVHIDGLVHYFTAHLVARRSWWRGPVLAVMNAQYLGPWDVAPRAHPNDGRLDVLEADLSLGDRWKARARLPTGTHVPHPRIRQRRTAGFDTVFERDMTVWLDGGELGPVRELSIRVVPDALTVVV